MMPETVSTTNSAQRFIDISIEKVIKLHESGYTDQAIAQYADLLSLYPDNDDVRYNLAVLYHYSGHDELAIPLLEDLPAYSPHYADSLCKLGTMLGRKGDFSGGAERLTNLLKLDESRVDCHNHLARYLIELGRPEEAQQHLLRSIQLQPDCDEAYNYLGNLYVRYWRLREAREQYQRAIDLQPDQASAYCNLAWIATLEGNIAEAISLFNTALEIFPEFRVAANNLSFTHNYSDIYTPEYISNEHRRLSAIYNAPELAYDVREARPEGKIRVGYVSGDFKTHSVAFFFESVLRNHNRSEFEIYCYDMVTVPDETTQRMKNFGWAWRSIYGLTDDVVAEHIRTDSIDILVDLSGHTEGNRLGVFALKTAPVQVTWLGYPNTTGLTQIDYRISDFFADPPGMTEHLHTEQLVRLPRSFLCYSPPVSAPEVAELPNGPIIFCSFNHYPKISDTTINLWSRVLHELPDALLSLKNGSLFDAHVRELLFNRFSECGIERNRLIICSRSGTREEHLQQYGSCHIALDTYPYHGTTTTCEALLMGVPVITMAGRSHAARVGVSILNNAGLPELVAYDADQFVAIAVALANSPERLQEYRRCLRDRFLHSAMTDAKSFTADLEQTYKKMLPTNLFKNSR